MVFIKEWVWLVLHICKSWLQVLCILNSMSITINFHRESQHAWLISLISGRELSLIIRAATLHSWRRTNRSVGNKETILTHISHWARSYCTWDWGSVVNHNDTCIHNTYIVYTTEVQDLYKGGYNTLLHVFNTITKRCVLVLTVTGCPLHHVTSTV